MNLITVSIFSCSLECEPNGVSAVQALGSREQERSTVQTKIFSEVEESDSNFVKMLEREAGMVSSFWLSLICSHVIQMLNLIEHSALNKADRKVVLKPLPNMMKPGTNGMTKTPKGTMRKTG